MLSTYLKSVLITKNVYNMFLKTIIELCISE